MRGFLDYLASKGSPFHGQIVRFYITSYIEHLDQLGYKVNTINKKINSLVCFNQFLLEREIMDRMVVDLRRDKIRVAYGSEQEVEVYTENEVERLLFYIQDTEKVSVRDKLIILLLLYTGLRVSELVSIKIKDLDFLTMRPHKFRHTFCTRLLKAGVPLTTTAKIAGHARIQTTAAFYINTSRQDKQDAVDLL